MKHLVLLNLYSGKTANINTLGHILKACLNLDLHFEFIASKYQGHISSILAENIHNLKTLILAGGDGTLKETCQILSENKDIIFSNDLDFLYLPTGTTCDFAASLKLSSNLSENIKQWQYSAMQKKYLDLASFHSEDQNSDFYSIFTYIASFGAFTATSYNTSRELKQKLGHFAYLLNGFNELTKIKNYSIELEVDGVLYKENVVFFAVTNSTSIAGIIKLDDSQVAMDDGIYELILVNDPYLPFLRPARLLQLALNTSLKIDGIKILKGKNIKIYSNEKIAWTLDGEYGGIHQKVEIKVQQKILPILSPKN